MSKPKRTPDDVLVECPSCGQTVLEVYVEDGECPDCRDEP